MDGQRKVKVRNQCKKILIYHGIMKVRNHIQNLVNPNPLEVPNHQESLRQRQKRNRPVKICLKCKGHHDEKDSTKFLFRKGKEKSASPQPIKPNLQIDKSEAKVEEKWDPLRRDNDVDKDTERLVEEQNAFFKRKNKRVRSLLGLILKGL